MTLIRQLDSARRYHDQPINGSEQHMSEDTQEGLSKADVDAIAAALEKRLMERFQSNVGRGVLGYVWKAVLLVLIGLAVAGAVKTGHIF